MSLPFDRDQIFRQKWFDPECHDGCQSLFFKQQIKTLRLKLERIAYMVKLSEDRGDMGDRLRKELRNILDN